MDPWVGKIPWRREWLLIPVFLLGRSHGQRSLWELKELDTIKQPTPPPPPRNHTNGQTGQEGTSKTSCGGGSLEVGILSHLGRGPRGIAPVLLKSGPRLEGWADCWQSFRCGRARRAWPAPRWPRCFQEQTPPCRVASSFLGGSALRD